MSRGRVWIRALLGITLVGACVAAAIAPALTMVQAAPPPIPPAASLAPSNLVISSFRFRGSAGNTDEYVQIYNRSCDTAETLTGYKLMASDDAAKKLLYTFPAGSSLPAGGYYLIKGAGYDDATNPGGNAPVVPPVSYDADASTYDISGTTGGVALLNSSDNQVDAAGYVGASNGYQEGSPLTALGAANGDKAYFRKILASNGNMVADSNNNFGDFEKLDASTTWAPTCGQPQPITISGKVTVGTTALAGVSITWTGMIGTAPQTDTNGDYSFTVPVNWTGTVTPSKSGYTFTPKNYPNLFSDTTGQNYSAAVASSFHPDVVINEVAWNGTQGNATNDWIELYNNTGAAIDFSAGWRLTSPSGMVINLTGTIPAGGYYVLAHSGTAGFATHTPTPAASPACQIFKLSDYGSLVPPLSAPPIQYFTSSLSSLGQILFLYNDAGALEDYANLNGGAWPAGSSLTPYRTMERHSPYTADSDSAWYTFYGTPKIHDCQGLPVYGSPGYVNWAASVTATPSPVPTRYRTPTPLPPTPFAHMVINEFLPRAGYDWNQDGAVDVYDEFVELYNLGPINASLNGWKIDVISPGGNTSYSLNGVTLKPGERMVFYGLKTKLALHDLGGTVRLLNSRAKVVDARGYDPVAAPDQSTCRIPEGQYWTFPCFPTPGNQNSLTGTHPVPPPAVASQPPPCVMSDVIPSPFRQAECHPFGAGVFNPAYWDDQAGFKQFPVRDTMNKWRAVVE